MADSTDPLGVALIGCGLIGHKRAAALPKGSRLVTATDLVEEHARNLVDNLWPDAAVVADPVAAIEHPEVNLVIVATTHDQLPLLGGLAVDRGRHLLLEKPGANCLPPLVDLARRAADAGVVVRVGYNHRFHPGLRRLHELATSGDYGPLLWLRGRYGHGGRVGYEREWRADPAEFIGRSLIGYASQEILAAEATLADRGWHEGELATLEIATAGTLDPVIPILPGRVLWERIALADGSAGRLVTTIA